MKRLFTPLLATIFCVVTGLSQQARVVTGSGSSPLNFQWGNDVLVSPSEPQGQHSAVARSDGSVFVAVPDTAITPGFAIRVFMSTDFGENWTMLPDGISPAFEVSKLKMVRSGADSVYCIYQTGSSIFCWNIESGNLNTVPANPARDFDIVASTLTEDLFIFVDEVANNSIRRYGSSDGGTSWPSTGLVTSSGASPRVYMSTGDTLTLNYYGPVLADTSTSIIRGARYRRTGPATLSSVNFQDVATSSAHKDQFASVIFAGTVWFFYTSGDPGSIDIKCRVSTDNGATYGVDFDVAADPNTSEFWFDAKNGSDRVDVVHIADTAGANDGVRYTTANISNPSTFLAPTQISEHPPMLPSAVHVPAIAEFYDPAGDVGAVWVGQGIVGSSVYWDRFGSGLVDVGDHVGTPTEFHLYQNYPNPFNPSTSVRYDVPSRSHVTLTVYDVLGREVATLVNEDKAQGSYHLTFDGSQLSSGVYIYTLRSEHSIQTRKMLLLR